MRSRPWCFTRLAVRAILLNEAKQWMNWRNTLIFLPRLFESSVTTFRILRGSSRSDRWVVFEDGTPRKDAYRHFNIHGDDGNGRRTTPRQWIEVLRRRFRVSWPRKTVKMAKMMRVLLSSPVRSMLAGDHGVFPIGQILWSSMAVFLK